jgi:hypothetical protein
MGAPEFLDKKRIDIIEVEAGMNCKNTWHVPLEKLKSFLEAKGYFIFTIYEQVNEWPSGEPQLRRANSVYLSEAVIDDNKPHL